MILAAMFLSACVREDHFGRSSLRQIRYFTLENQSGTPVLLKTA
jgi:hypothetical protein